MTRYRIARFLPGVMVFALPLVLSLHEPHGVLQKTLYVACYPGTAALVYATWKHWGKPGDSRSGGVEGPTSSDDPLQ